jgi:hypothetical protein
MLAYRSIILRIGKEAVLDKLDEFRANFLNDFHDSIEKYFGFIC